MRLKHPLNLWRAKAQNHFETSQSDAFAAPRLRLASGTSGFIKEFISSQTFRFCGNRGTSPSKRGQRVCDLSATTPSTPEVFIPVAGA